MALKDSAGLVKMYAMVNVEQYQIVATATSLAECESNYIDLLASHNLADSETVEEADVTGTIADIRTAVVEGTTRVYVRLEGMDFYYVISVASSENAILFNVGDKVNLKTSASTGELRSAYQISAAK